MPPAAPDPWARASGVGVGVSGAGEGGDEVVQSGVELGDLCCGGAFLGPEHGGGAGESEQRAGDVAGDDEVDPIKIDCAAAVDTVDAVQVLSGGGQQLAGAVEEAVAERGQHADSTVGAGAAAQREHQACAGQGQRCSDGFAEAVARRCHRGEHPAGQGGQSAGVGDFHDGGVAVERDDSAVVAVRSPRAPSPAGDGTAGQGGGDAAVAAVGQWEGPAVCTGLRRGLSPSGRRPRLR